MYFCSGQPTHYCSGVDTMELASQSAVPYVHSAMASGARLNALVIVKPETVIRWHRAGFGLFWRWKSRSRGGRPKVPLEIRQLIREMSLANPLWGAPRIHGELLKLGIEIGQTSVAKYMARHRKPPTQGWKTFLRNHADGIASMDLFVVPTLSFRLLYGLLILWHGQRSWASLIAEASQRFGVPAHWIRAVMQAESTGDTGAMSPKGAMGLMQVMPETYAELRLRYHLGTDPYEPHSNILAGAAYLREMHDRFGPDGFLAAYNAGPGRYEDYLKSGRPLPEETRNYVATLAPVIGVPGVPHHSASASTASQLTTSAAAHDGGEQLRASSKSKFTSAILQFDDRQDARTQTLFAMLRTVFEPTSTSAQTIDMTALEPSPARALNATSTAAASLRIRTSTASRSSLAPSGDALFAINTHTR